MTDYKIFLRDRNESVEYSDERGTYYFAAYLAKGNWKVCLPCSLNGTDHELSAEEYERIIPKIKEGKSMGVYGESMGSGLGESMGSGLY